MAADAASDPLAVDLGCISHPEPSDCPHCDGPICECCHIDCDTLEEGEEAVSANAKRAPLGAVIVILAICFSEGVSATILNPFAGLMVELVFGVPSAEVGYWVGLLTASFFLGQFVSSFPVGMAADRLGRRPVLLTGIVGNAITLAMFGFSRSLWWAMAWRMVAGVMNGNSAVVKTYIRDISTEETQARLYSWRSSMRATGFLVGPMLGGLLARPAESPVLSWVAEEVWGPGIFVAFPYLLPCLVAAALNVVMLVGGFLFLEETLRRTKKAEEVDEGGREGEESEGLVGETEETGREETDRLSWSRVLNRNVVITIFLFVLLSLVWVGWQEVLPVWAIRSRDEHGLDFEEAQVGIISGMGAVGMILFQAFAYSPLDKRLGTLTLHRMILVSYYSYSGPVAQLSWNAVLATSDFTVCWIPMFLLLPVANLLVGTPIALWVYLAGLVACINAMGTAVMAAVNLMINNSADPSCVGIVNGLSACSSAGARVVAPIACTWLFTWSANFNEFPINYTTFFVATAAMCGCILSVTLTLDAKVNRRRQAEGDGVDEGETDLTDTVCVELEDMGGKLVGEREEDDDLMEV